MNLGFPTMDMQSNQPSLVIRIYRGIADHFNIRLTEWAMLLPTFGMWFVLQMQPDMFSRSPSFLIVASIASEPVWAFMCGFAGICRFAALVINGTFKGFRLSPHIRLAASLIGVVIWSQFSLGILHAYVSNDGLLSGFIAWSLPVLLELMNTTRSGLDVGKQFPKEY